MISIVTDVGYMLGCCLEGDCLKHISDQDQLPKCMCKSDDVVNYEGVNIFDGVVSMIRGV